ncbi:putative kinase involved in propanediol utilization [Thermanaerovibrio velox DSM 12556]|uniref:Putative kinase involved in propanediol utilization n=1 Tax=Thermanaerovibrio velox DSM 12556 TaxID=926567 RepID=H0UMZ3_9BACT|nr:hypothetical protein [Thermanaerovibrio velox]EHM09272.1 putative kinase involved in propanediol utilization [Thermanaerovibrio velox DSM 12556]
MRKAFASLRGTVGEWIQGWILPDGEALVSLAVEWRGRVTVEEGRSPRALPPKAHRALKLARESFGLDGAVSVEVENPLRPALGLGTSTMDVGGVLASCAVLKGVDLGEEELFRLCCSVEPSDGTMFRGLALVDHIRGRLIERLPEPPDMWLAAMLPYRTLDTEVYRKDRGLMKAVRDRSQRHVKAYQVLKRGLVEGNCRKVAAAATMSAIIQQAIMPREEWPLLLGACREFKGIGLAVAHSGTASAVIFKDLKGAEACREFLAKRWDLGEVRTVKACGGGVEVGDCGGEPKD